MTALEKTQACKKQAEYAAKHRQKKNQATTSSPKRGYKTPQSLGKAKKRLQDILPRSPNKRRQLISGLAKSEKLIDKMETQLEKNEYANSPTNELVKAFFTREDISYHTPGTKEEMCVWINGRKERLRKYYLMMTLKEAFVIFKTENVDVKIGFSKFASLRPANVLLLKDSPADQCKCSIHENFMLKLKCLDTVYENQFWKECLCDSENWNGECWKNECRECKNGIRFERTRKESDKAKSVSWKQWNKDESGRLFVETVDGCVGELEEKILEALPTFQEHVRIKKIQADYFQELKSNPNGSMIQVDFAMSYVCEYQNEIQSALWSRSSVNLFTAALFYKGRYVKSFLLVSDCKDKGKNSVLTFLKKLLQEICESDFGDFGETLTIFSDGPSSEFKNKFCVKMLQILKTSLNLPVKMQWAYSATSHGKGIIDGIGGRAKSLVKRAVMGKKGVIVQNATDFANVASSLLKDTKVILVDERDIAAVDDTGVWDDVEDVHGIRKAHIVLLEDGVAKCFKSNLERSEEICHVVLLAQNDEFMVDAEKELKTSQFVKVKFNTKKTERFFVGEVISVDQLDVQVRFMRKKSDCVFVFPEKTDESFILKTDVCSILDCPIVDARGHYTFKHSIDAE